MINMAKRLVWVLQSFPKIVLCKIKNGERANLDWLLHIEKLVRLTVVKGTGNLTVGRGSHIKRGSELQLSGEGNLTIGSHVCINSNCYIAAQQNVTIGDGCELGPNVIIVDHDHDFRAGGGIRAGKYKRSSVVIGNNVWIGANTVVLRGTEIGDNCVVGAGSVISGKYPANTVIVQKREEETSIYECGV